MQPQDFKTMHSKAIEYAQQMHKKSSDYSHNNATQTDFTDDKQSSKDCGFKEFYNNKGINNIFNSNKSFKKNENDLNLILALILLLSADGGDKMLLLALLYIMT